MNAVEIEQAISDLAEADFDLGEFPFAFREAFGNKPATIKRLRTGNNNKSDIGGVLQANHIHIKLASTGQVSKTLADLRDSPATQNKRLKVRFILATDGVEFEAEDLTTGETVACAYTDFPNHFGVFLPLAGITTVNQIRENTFDVRATSRLNRLYVTLLQNKPGKAGRAFRLTSEGCIAMPSGCQSRNLPHTSKFSLRKQLRWLPCRGRHHSADDLV